MLIDFHSDNPGVTGGKRASSQLNLESTKNLFFPKHDTPLFIKAFIARSSYAIERPLHPSALAKVKVVGL